MFSWVAPTVAASFVAQAAPPVQAEPAAAVIDEAAIQWPEEWAIEDGYGRDLSQGPEGCVTRTENREHIAQLLTGRGFSISPRSRFGDKFFVFYTRPQRHHDRLVYHYFKLSEAICVPGRCLSSAAARIELPLGGDGRSRPQQAVNDPDRTTLALFEAAEAIGESCSRAG